MSCTIGVSVDDDCLRELENKLVTARKEHVCCECRGKIKKGDKYELFTGIGDGNIERYKTCEDCLSLRKAFFKDFYFERMWEDLKDHIYDNGEGSIIECLPKLTQNARDRVFGILEEYMEIKNCV